VVRVHGCEPIYDAERQVVARSVFQTEYLAGASPVGVANYVREEELPDSSPLKAKTAGGAPVTDANGLEAAVDWHQTFNLTQ
jgi:hypothetical protein